MNPLMQSGVIPGTCPGTGFGYGHDGYGMQQQQQQQQASPYAG